MRRDRAVGWELTAGTVAVLAETGPSDEEHACGTFWKHESPYRRTPVENGMRGTIGPPRAQGLMRCRVIDQGRGGARMFRVKGKDRRAEARAADDWDATVAGQGRTP